MMRKNLLRTFGVHCRLFSTSTNNSAVLLSFSDKNVATLTLNNPLKHNSMSDDVINLLHEKLNEVKLSKECRLLVLKSEGKNFSAGADLEYMKRLGSYSTEENIKDATNLSELFQKISDLEVPTLAVVQGSAFGGALGLISTCDIAICHKRSNFCFSEVKLGIIPATISPFVVRRIGFSQARRLFLSAELFGSDQALAVGLVHRATEDLRAVEIEYTEQLLRNGPEALKRTKKLLKAVETAHTTDKLNSTDLRRVTAELLAEARASEEAKEGLSSFLEKRKPKYSL